MNELIILLILRYKITHALIKASQDAGVSCIWYMACKDAVRIRILVLKGLNKEHTIQRMRKQESGYFLLEIKTQELVGDAMVNKDYPRLQFVS